MEWVCCYTLDKVWSVDRLNPQVIGVKKCDTVPSFITDHVRVDDFISDKDLLKIINRTNKNIVKTAKNTLNY